MPGPAAPLLPATLGWMTVGLVARVWSGLRLRSGRDWRAMGLLVVRPPERDR